MLGRVYRQCLKQFPTLTQVVQTGILMGTGDGIAQIVIEKKSLTDYNFIRTAQFASLGVFVVGPVLTTWYKFLAMKFGTGGAIVALKKVACDQLIFSPCFIFLFLGCLGTLQRQSVSQIKNNVKRDYGDILITNYKLWPTVQIVNFAVVPLQYQVLLVQIVAIFWNSYLSWKTQKCEQKIDAKY